MTVVRTSELACLLLLLGPLDSRASADGELTGGPASVRVSGRDAFSYPAPVLDRLQRRAFAVGNALFKDNWVIAPSSTSGRDGLGPLFNARSCSGCHLHDGRGQPPRQPGELSSGLVLRIGVVDRGIAKPHPLFGGQLQDDAVLGTTPEVVVDVQRTEKPGRYPDGTEYSLERLHFVPRTSRDGRQITKPYRLSPRVAPQIIGMGLLEAIGADTIRALADPDDLNGDGISGRINEVWDYSKQERALGRFGWKAAQPSVEQQVARAFQEDIGITSRLFAAEALTEPQRESIAYVSGGQPEITRKKLDRVVFYSQTLAVPARRPADEAVRRGEVLFSEIGCAACHLPALQTSSEARLPFFRNAKIQPFTDLLLHDMGANLADGLPEGEASGSEWRTPPLWGIGLIKTVSGHTRLLHDGRARNLEEAVLWHGGEAEPARRGFMHLESAARESVLAFLRSL